MIAWREAHSISRVRAGYDQRWNTVQQNDSWICAWCHLYKHMYDWPPNHLYILYSTQKKLAEELWQAVDKLDVVKVRSLLGQGADPNHQLYWSDEWEWKKPPLHLSCYQGYLEIAKTLVTHGARTDKGDGWRNMTPLHWACQGGHTEMVKYLIQELKCSTGKQSCINKIMFLRI